MSASGGSSSRTPRDTVRTALIAHAEGGTTVPPPVVITTTPSATPVLDARAVRPGAHITGIGTDMPHKNELPAELFRRAATIATDDHEQCLHHGNFGRAVRAGAVSESSDTPVGAILRAPALRPASAITVADLTGIGAVGAAVASRLTGDLLKGTGA